MNKIKIQMKIRDYLKIEIRLQTRSKIKGEKEVREKRYG